MHVYRTAYITAVYSTYDVPKYTTDFSAIQTADYYTVEPAINQTVYSTICTTE